VWLPFNLYVAYSLKLSNLVTSSPGSFILLLFKSIHTSARSEGSASVSNVIVAVFAFFSVFKTIYGCLGVSGSFDVSAPSFLQAAKASSNIGIRIVFFIIIDFAFINLSMRLMIFRLFFIIWFIYFYFISLFV